MAAVSISTKEMVTSSSKAAHQHVSFDSLGRWGDGRGDGVSRAFLTELAGASELCNQARQLCTAVAKKDMKLSTFAARPFGATRPPTVADEDDVYYNDGDRLYLFMVVGHRHVSLFRWKPFWFEARWRCTRAAISTTLMPLGVLSFNQLLISDISTA
jgi:hypothetical protein